MPSPRFVIVVDADPATKIVKLELRFPDETMKFVGNLNSLRSFAESDLETFGPLLGKGSLQDLRVDLRRILLNVEKEFGEKSENSP
jgi:hypothetical protein